MSLNPWCVLWPYERLSCFQGEVDKTWVFLEAVAAAYMQVGQIHLGLSPHFHWQEIAVVKENLGRDLALL